METKKSVWFVRKTYGWGWVPATWQGVCVVVVFLLAHAWNIWRLLHVPVISSPDIRIFVVRSIVFVGILIYVCFRTGESPRWQWGEREQKE